jgi:hypothetical protein
LTVRINISGQCGAQRRRTAPQGLVIGPAASQESFGQRLHTLRHRRVADPHLAQCDFEMPENGIGQVLCDGRRRILHVIQPAQDQRRMHRNRFETSLERILDSIIREQNRISRRCHDLAVKSVDH